MRNDIFVVVDVVFFSLSQFRIKTQTQFHADLYATVYEFLHFYLMYTFFGQVQNHSNIVLEKLMFFCCCSFSSLFLHFPFAVAVCMCFIFFGHFVFMCFFSAWAPSKNRMFLSVGRKLDLDLANRLTIKANGYARARPLKHCARSLQIYFIFQFSEFSLMLQLLSNVFVLALSHSLSLSESGCISDCLFLLCLPSSFCEISISISSGLWLFLPPSSRANQFVSVWVVFSLSASSFYHICLSRLP